MFLTIKDMSSLLTQEITMNYQEVKRKADLYMAELDNVLDAGTVNVLIAIAIEAYNNGTCVKAITIPGQSKSVNALATLFVQAEIMRNVLSK